MPTNDQLVAAQQAIKDIESRGGNYGAIGPVTRSGDQAYGAYQMMGANIPSWTQQSLGVSMTPQQFLNDPSAQDKTFNNIYGGYLDKYGMSGASSKWFTGSATGAGTLSDGITSNNEYVNRATTGYNDYLDGGTSKFANADNFNDYQQDVSLGQAGDPSQYGIGVGPTVGPSTGLGIQNESMSDRVSDYFQDQELGQGANPQSYGLPSGMITREFDVNGNTVNPYTGQPIDPGEDGTFHLQGGDSNPGSQPTFTADPNGSPGADGTVGQNASLTPDTSTDMSNTTGDPSLPAQVSGSQSFDQVAQQDTQSAVSAAASGATGIGASAAGAASIPAAIIAAGQMESKAIAAAATTQSKTAAANAAATNATTKAVQASSQSYFANWAVRIFLFIVGAIFLAAGLYMFRSGESLTATLVMAQKRVAA